MFVYSGHLSSAISRRWPNLETFSEICSSAEINFGADDTVHVEHLGNVFQEAKLLKLICKQMHDSTTDCNVLIRLGLKFK